jgi:hypothetical protein
MCISYPDIRTRKKNLRIFSKKMRFQVMEIVRVNKKNK